jgi:hypothetical protein
MGSAFASASKPNRRCALTPWGAIPPTRSGVGAGEAADQGSMSRSWKAFEPVSPPMETDASRTPVSPSLMT